MPDSWFLPAVKSLLQLPLRNGAKQSPHIELLVNTTPSERSMSPATTLRRNMSVVLPALKVLSGLNAKIQPPSAAAMDLTHHRVGFETSDATSLDWVAMQKLLTAANPAIIDAKALAEQTTMLDYLTHEVARRAGDSGPPRWLIVLSGPVVLVRQEETPMPQLPPDPNRHIVYLRFASGFGNGPLPNTGLPGPEIQIAPGRRVHGPMPGLGTVLPGGPGRGRGAMTPPVQYPDDLEHVLRSMGAQIIGVENPEEFRKTVASLIEEISAN